MSWLNAAKYGALSNDTGTVHITWLVGLAENDNRLNLVWQEAGGPFVGPPTCEGFGSLLLDQALKSELGSTSLEFRPDGVVCSMELSV